MTNFDFLKKEPKFSSFADVAISAERILLIDYSASILNCRRAMEFAIKWMYSVDRSLEDVSFTKGSLRIDMDFHDCRLTKEVILNIIKNIGTPLGNKVRHILFDLLPEDKVENVEDYKYVYSVEEYDKFIKPAHEAVYTEGCTCYGVRIDDHDYDYPEVSQSDVVEFLNESYENFI